MADEELIVKNISLFTENHFPNIYLEDGSELVDLARQYYKWLETDQSQSIYNARRMFEYRDISTTLEKMLVFYKKKFLADLPYNKDTISFVVRNILDLYQRKGTSDGIELFFKLFYDETALITYPATQMLKPSNSQWNTGNYLQLFANSNEFFSESGQKYTYADLIARNVQGSLSEAKAAVRAVNLVVLNGGLIPIIYIDQVQGIFQRYDQLSTYINGEFVVFGQMNGSLTNINMDLDYNQATTGNKVGDILNVVTSDTAVGGKVIVTGITTKITGEIKYRIENGGWGYTLENTALEVSNQVVFPVFGGSYATMDDIAPVPLERVTNGSLTGEIIGYSDEVIAIKVNDPGGIGYLTADTITTLDRVDDQGNPNNISFTVLQASEFNNTSPGDLFPDTGDPLDVAVNTLTNVEAINVITDPIAPYLSITVDAADYGAATPMSGSASPVNYTTVLSDAFDLTSINVGTIDTFKNVVPGSGYKFDVWAIARDPVISSLSRYDQEISFPNPATAGAFNINEIITEQSTGVQGIIRKTNSSLGYITVTPYSYYGFSGGPIVRGGGVGDVYVVLDVNRDYSSTVAGLNADIETVTSFAAGKIETVAVRGSGFGYLNDEVATLTNDLGEPQAQGLVDATRMGVTAGYWAEYSSHLNGFTKTLAEDGEDEYYEGNMRIQDSDYFQEYSYVIKSKIDPGKYQKLLRESVHLAGTKPFSQFLLRSKTGTVSSGNFIRYFNDDGQGSPFDQAELNEITSDIINFTVDSDTLTSDNEPTP